MVRHTQLRWSILFVKNASDQLIVILRYCGIERTFNTTMEVYQSQAFDSHLSGFNLSHMREFFTRGLRM